MSVTNPQAVLFCNEKVRPAADKLAQAYNLAKIVVAEWNAGGYTGSGNPEYIPDSDSEQVYDGSESDGRPLLFGDEVYLLVTRLNELITDYEATSFAKLNTILDVAVNTKP